MSGFHPSQPPFQFDDGPLQSERTASTEPSFGNLKDGLTREMTVVNDAALLVVRHETHPVGAMKLIHWFTLVALLGGANFPARAADEEGIALAILYDTSGSMKKPVRAGNGQMMPKYAIANRALEAIIQRIQNFATNTAGGPARKVHAGLFIFDGNGAKEAVPFGPFDPAAMLAFVRKFNTPTSGTPLGNAVEFASRSVLNSSLSSKHLLVVTDGENTIDPPPQATIPKINKAASAKNAVVFTHFVAFDVNANVFAPLKKLGVTVVGAADEKQLKSQLEFILEEKILLEKEPAPKKK